jgi:hypothetical protein
MGMMADLKFTAAAPLWSFGVLIVQLRLFFCSKINGIDIPLNPASLILPTIMTVTWLLPGEEVYRVH